MSFLFCGFLATVLALVVLKLYIKLTTGWCRSNVCLVGKTVIVTGANSGIGFEAAEDFAKRGAKVILACRNESRGKDAEDRIKKATNNENIFFKNLDLSSLKSVRNFAQEIIKSEKRLDILLNNAGSLLQGPEKSEDGLLLIMAGNYFGPFLLTNLLLDLLKKTPNSRIVNVSSFASKLANEIDVNNLNRFPKEERFSSWKAYARTKACNILFTTELAKRLKGTDVTVYSTNPGLVQTSIFGVLPTQEKVFITQILNWFLKSTVEGAQTSIYCSVTKGIESLSGEHFVDCHPVTKYANLQDPDLPEKLWEASMKLLNLKS